MTHRSVAIDVSLELDVLLDAGETCDQLAAYSVTPIYEDNRVVDYTCDNQVNSCRWRICQCDRAFAHKIKMKVCTSALTIL